MIDLPEHLINSVFDEEIKRGSVVKTFYLFKGDKEEREKFIIILNHDITKDPFACVFTTIKDKFIKNNPQFANEMIHIPSGTFDYFPLDTIIKCDNVEKIPKELLKKNFCNNRLKFVGNLPKDIVTKISDIILKSYYIAPSDKRLVLGDAVDHPDNPLPSKRSGL